MHVRKSAASSALVVTAALVLAGCAGSSAPNPSDSSGPAIATDSLEDLITAAKAEGSVALLGEIQEPDLLALGEGFTGKYGIDVQTIRLGGNSFAQRFDAETQAGSTTVDVLIGGNLEFFKDMIDKENLVSFNDSGVRDLFGNFPDEYALDDFGVPLLSTIATGFLYNTTQVAAADVPISWDELTSDEWTGRFCSVDPATQLSLVQFFSVVRSSEPESVLAGMGEKMGRWYPDIVAMNESVAVGECEIALNSAQFFAEGMKAAGAPVEFAAAPTTVFPTPTTAVVAQAPHPNAARLFMHYILSEEGNALLNTEAIGEFGPWAGDRMPEDFWVPKPDQFGQWRAETPEILEILGL